MTNVLIGFLIGMMVAGTLLLMIGVRLSNLRKKEQSILKQQKPNVRYELDADGKLIEVIQ